MEAIAASCSHGVFKDLENAGDKLALDVLEAAQAINCHRVFNRVNDIESVRIFAEHHVWCVWDFMSLAKSIQMKLGCYEIPWTPPTSTLMSHAFNEVIMSEESDDGPSGLVQSHFEIYLEAMTEMGANATSVPAAIAHIKRGVPLDKALQAVGASLATRQFVASTMMFADSPLHVAVGAFCLGREELLPGITERLLEALPNNEPRLTLFRWYLNRHIELDSTCHGPITTDLLKYCIAGNDTLRTEALTAGLRAIQARHEYLSSIATMLDIQS